MSQATEAEEEAERLPTPHASPIVSRSTNRSQWDLRLDSLAQELAAHPPGRPRTGTSPFATPTAHSPPDSPDSETGPSFAAAPPLALTDKHALLRHLEKTSPETLALARDWEDVAWSVARAQQKLAKCAIRCPSCAHRWC